MPLLLASSYRGCVQYIGGRTEGFIQHCLNLLNTYLALDTVYANKLDFFTKSDLKYEKYDFYPQPLPDAHIRLKTSGITKEFFLDIFEDSQPFFVLIRRIKKYLEYAGNGDWPEEVLPTILLIVENKSVHKQLRKRLVRELRVSYEEITFATTKLKYLINANYKGKVWFPIDEDGDEPGEPLDATPLTRLPRADD